MHANFLLLLVIAASTISCNNKIDTHSIDKIEYGFHDASVAPEYHRSYSITITPSQLVVAIKSYNQLLRSETRKFSKEQFEEVRKKFSELKKDGHIDESAIPDGGTSESIKFMKGNTEVFYGEDYGPKNRNFSGVDDISISYLVPDLSALIESTRKKDEGQPQ